MRVDQAGEERKVPEVNGAVGVKPRVVVGQQLNSTSRTKAADSATPDGSTIRRDLMTSVSLKARPFRYCPRAHPPEGPRANSSTYSSPTDPSYPSLANP